MEDAAKWAADFMRIKNNSKWVIEDIDESLMLGWFAAAICAEYDRNLLEDAGTELSCIVLALRASQTEELRLRQALHKIADPDNWVYALTEGGGPCVAWCDNTELEPGTIADIALDPPEV